MSTVFTAVSSGDTVDAVDIQQVIDALTAVSTGGVPISITQVNSSASFALDVRNRETGLNRAFRVSDSTGTVRFQIASTVDLGSAAVQIDPDGTGTLSNIATDLLASTMANKTLSSCTLSTTTKVALGSDATGDIWYRNSSGEMARLAAGSSGYTLQMVNGLPTWVAGGGGGGFTDPVTLVLI